MNDQDLFETIEMGLDRHASPELVIPPALEALEALKDKLGAYRQKAELAEDEAKTNSDDALYWEEQYTALLDAVGGVWPG